MDLNTITEIRPARSREDLAYLASDHAPLSGGSWLFSEPQDHLTGLLDLTAMAWPSLIPAADGLEIASTCTLAELAALPPREGWTAHPLFYQCCTALLGSFKVWNVATVGGNVCASLPAGPMTSLLSALDATALVWRGDGSDAVIPVADFVTGSKQNRLSVGDVVRSFHIPISSLRARTGYRKIALSALGRTGSVVIGRLDEDERFTLTVTGATLSPRQLRYPSVPTDADLAADVAALEGWFTDAHGAADWRRSVSTVLAREIRDELAAQEVAR